MLLEWLDENKGPVLCVTLEIYCRLYYSPFLFDLCIFYFQGHII